MAALAAWASVIEPRPTVLSKLNYGEKTMSKLTFEPSYDIKSYNEENPSEIEYHFFGSSAAEWYTDVDFQKVHKYMAKQGYSFNIYFVPVHAKARYNIRNYAPQGVDAHYLGTYHVG